MPMPDWLQVILLGVVEGITEFLPVSDREKQYGFTLGKKTVKDEKKIAK